MCISKLRNAREERERCEQFRAIVRSERLELPDIAEVNGLLVRVTTSEGVKANVIIVPPIDVTVCSIVE